MTLPSSSSPSAPAAAAAAAAEPDDPTSLAPGFRFHPTDEELVSYYLKRKVLGRPLKVDAIAEVDLYKLEPWDLPARSRLRSRDSQWYFFSRLDRKHANRARTNRATAGGYWKTTGKDREVRHGPMVAGMKKTLVFHSGRAPKGERTNWVMHEYRLEGDGAAGIPQDSFVVCRIFQKAGPGPQNGAQYGAPFVEEEWDADDVGLLPLEGDADVDAEREAPGAMEKGYLQMSDLIQDCGGQNENGGVALPVSDSSNNSNHSEVAEGNSGDILNDPNLGSNFLQHVDPGEQNSLMLNGNMLSNANGGDLLNSSSPSNAFMELKDLGYPLGNDSSTWPSGGSDWRTPHSFEHVNGANNEAPPITGEHIFQPDELEQLLQSLQDDSPLGSTITDVPQSSLTNSVQPEDDFLMFHDAPFDSTMFNDGFGQSAGFLGSPVTNLSGIGMVDDGMPYYDAIDDNLFNDMMCSGQQSAGSGSHLFNGPVLSQEVNNTTYTYSPTQKVLEPNFVVGAPSSARLPEAGSQLNCNLPDAPARRGAIVNHFVKVLDSITGPNAFASEFPPNLRKSLAPISGAHPNTISVSTEVISMEKGSLTVASRQDKWSFQKGEDMELLFSTGSEPGTRMHCGGCNTVTAVLRSGFCLFFLSAIMLLVSCEVGLCIYGK